MPALFFCTIVDPDFRAVPRRFSQEATDATTAGLASTSTVEIVGFIIAFLLGETLIPPYANLALASNRAGSPGPASSWRGYSASCGSR